MTKAKAKEPAILPEPGERERRAIARAQERVQGRRKRFAVTLEPVDGVHDLNWHHSDAKGGQTRLLDTFGTPSHDYAYDALGTLAAVIRENGQSLPTSMALNAALAFVDSLEPANELEGALAVQMATTHALAMKMLGRTRQADQLTQLEAQGALAVKLLRTFALQAETLAKLKRGGGQTVRVEHVHVHSGGQAIVGHVEAGGVAAQK